MTWGKTRLRVSSGHSSIATSYGSSVSREPRAIGWTRRSASTPPRCSGRSLPTPWPLVGVATPLHFARWMEGRNSPPVWGFVPHTIAQSQEREEALVRETSNLIVACNQAIADGAPSDDVLRLAYGAGIALQVVHRYGEAIDLFERALGAAPCGSPSLRGHAERWYATALIYAGRFDDGRAVLELALASSREAGRLDEVLAVEQNLSFVAYRRGEDSVRPFVEDAVRVATESGDGDLIAFARATRGSYPEHFDPEQCLDDLRAAAAHFKRRGCEPDYLSALGWLATTELEVGDLAAAKLHFEETLLARSSTMDVSHLGAHLNLAQIELERGDVAAAVRRWEIASLVVESRSIGSMYVICVLIGALCCATASLHEVAATLFGATDSLVAASGLRIEPYEAKQRENAVTVLQTALGIEEVERLRLDGMALELRRGSEHRPCVARHRACTHLNSGLKGPALPSPVIDGETSVPATWTRGRTMNSGGRCGIRGDIWADRRPINAASMAHHRALETALLHAIRESDRLFLADGTTGNVPRSAIRRRGRRVRHHRTHRR